MINTLINLTEAYGISGDEKQVADVLYNEMSGLYDEHFEDALGNQYFVKYGKNRNKKLVFAAHMDEIGFIINMIEENGTGRFLPIGHHDARHVVNQDMIVLTDNDPVFGVTGEKPANITNQDEAQKVTPIDELFIDFGTRTAEETRALGVEEGCLMTYARHGTVFNNGTCFTGNDRAALTALVEAFKKIAGEEIESTAILVGTCQEKVGAKYGASMSYRLQPEVFITVDVSFAGGTPGYSDEEAVCIMGEGPSIKYFDWDPTTDAGNIVSRKLLRKIEDIAEKYVIHTQKEMCIGGGTDMAVAAGHGCMSGIIGIPERYMHTAVGTVDLNDIEATADLIAAFIREY